MCRASWKPVLRVIVTNVGMITTIFGMNRAESSIRAGIASRQPLVSKGAADHIDAVELGLGGDRVLLARERERPSWISTVQCLAILWRFTTRPARKGDLAGVARSLRASTCAFTFSKLTSVEAKRSSRWRARSWAKDGLRQATRPSFS